MVVAYLDSNITQSIQSQLSNASIRAVNAQYKKPGLQTQLSQFLSMYF